MKLLEILEEVAGKEYGDILFGDKNDPPEFAKMQRAKPGSEPDIPKEKKLLWILKKWTSAPEFAIEDLYKQHSKLKSLANDYPKILKPSTPNGTLLYRGLKNVNSQIEKQVKLSGPEDWVKAGRLYVLKTPINYVPRSDIQSWTTDRKTAQWSFGLEGGMLVTKQTDEYLLNQKVLNVLYGLTEDEVLHFGKDYSQANVYFAGDMNAGLIIKYGKKLSKVKSVADSSDDFDVTSVVK